MWKGNAEPADSYYAVRPDIGNAPKSTFKIKPGKTLSPRAWHAAFSSDGHLDISSVLGRIRKGGVHPTIRGEVWEFLLGCFDPMSTFEEREHLRQKRRVQYQILKAECREMDAHVGSGVIVTAPLITEDGEPTNDPLVLLEALTDQRTSQGLRATASSSSSGRITDKHVIDWKLALHQIGLDVLRTDRTLVFYEKKENLSKLWDILAVYAWVDKDVGYCQGMSDICSPMIMLLNDEADSFWCFERLMRRLRGNFRGTRQSVGVESQLQNLASITQVVDPKLHQHLEALGGGDYLFAIRMFMVLFRRELSLVDSLYLWEMMWALEYDPDMFHMYEQPNFATDRKDFSSRGRAKSIKQFGKFERENIRNGGLKGPDSDAPLPITVFLVASVLKEKSEQLTQEARGLDDVVQILNDLSGNIDARKACAGALKLHKKYLKKAKQLQGGSM